MGDIKGNLLSPGLLTLLKHRVQEEKRYPSGLIPMVCRQLSGRHVAVYKWEKKLKAGPSRPHAAPDASELAERPQKILEYLKENSGKPLDHLWKEVLAEDATDEVKHGWYHDLHWLLNQGHVILLSDGKMFLAKERGEGGGGNGRRGGAKKKGSRKRSGGKGKKKVEVVPLPDRGRRPVMSRLDRVAARGERGGLYGETDEGEEEED